MVRVCIEIGFMEDYRWDDTVGVKNIKKMLIILWGCLLMTGFSTKAKKFGICKFEVDVKNIGISQKYGMKLKFGNK